MSSDTTTGEVPMKANEPPTSDVATRSPWGGATRPGVADLAPTLILEVDVASAVAEYQIGQ